MSNDSAFPPVTLGNNIIVPPPQGRADAANHKPDLQALPEDTAARNGPRPSRELTLRKDWLIGRLTRRSTFDSLNRLSQTADLRPKLKRSAKDGKPEPSSPTNPELVERLKDHEGRVFILDTSGMPQYIFERQNGVWQGFSAIDDSNLKVSSPSEMLVGMINNAPPGLVFNVTDLPTSIGRDTDRSDVDSEWAREEELFIQPQHPTEDGAASIQKARYA
jgi:hypothetical protein